MSRTTLLSKSAAIIAFLGLAGCDPGVELGWDGRIEGTVDLQCVEKAIEVATGRVSRSDHVDDGSVYPRGTRVTYFSYGRYDEGNELSRKGDYGLELAQLPDGAFVYRHKWLKIGTNVSAQERAAVIPLMQKVNTETWDGCGVSFGDSIPASKRPS